MVASSSLVEWSGTLQCGIRAYVAAWASMGHEEPVSRDMLPEHSRNKSINDRKISLKKFFLSDSGVGALEDLVGSISDVADS